MLNLQKEKHTHKKATLWRTSFIKHCQLPACEQAKEINAVHELRNTCMIDTGFLSDAHPFRVQGSRATISAHTREINDVL